MRTLLMAFALACSINVALAATEAPADAPPGVADMLQRRHESQLREQYAKEGRWDEIKQMDEEQVRRQQVQKKQTITKLNAELAREGVVDTGTNGDGVFTICGPQRPPARTSGTDTTYVK